MITTGSKLLFGSAVAAALFAVAYGIAQGGYMGTIGLTSASIALFLLAGINVFAGDSNVSAMDHENLNSSAAAQATAQPSLWPLVVGLGATTMTLGLATYRPIFVLGLIAFIAGALEWLIQGWSERASADNAYNSNARHQLIGPLEMPITAAAGAGIIVFSFSRVMLGLPSSSATVVAFAALAGIVLIVGAFIGMKRQITRSALTGVFSVAAIALVAAGAFAGLNGEREIHEHETTAFLAEENECGSEETEADQNASQTVATKSNLAAEVTFDGEALIADVTGFNGNFDELTLPRSNPNNVLFRNESGHHARFVVELHPDLDDDGEPLGPERLCTAIVEDGGAQLLTILFSRSSRTIEEGYSIVVPDSGVELEVVVP
jgi:hypothetical protein